MYVESMTFPSDVLAKTRGGLFPGHVCGDVSAVGDRPIFRRQCGADGGDVGARAGGAGRGRGSLGAVDGGPGVVLDQRAGKVGSDGGRLRAGARPDEAILVLRREIAAIDK